MILTVVETAIGEDVYDEQGALYQRRVRTGLGVDIYDANGVLASQEVTIAGGRLEDSAPLGDDDPDPPAEGGSDVIRSATIQLNNAQILALPTTPITVVPGQGEGTYIVPIMCVIEKDFPGAGGPIGGLGNISNNSLDQGSTDFVVGWGDNEVNAFRPVPIPPIQFGSACMAFFCIPWQQVSDPIAVEDGLFPMGIGLNSDLSDTNKPLKMCADNAGGDFTGGFAGNKMTITVYYAVRTFRSLT